MTPAGPERDPEPHTCADEPCCDHDAERPASHAVVLKLSNHRHLPCVQRLAALGCPRFNDGSATEWRYELDPGVAPGDGLAAGRARSLDPPRGEPNAGNVATVATGGPECTKRR